MFYTEIEIGNGQEAVVLQKLLCKGKLDNFSAVIETELNQVLDQRRMSCLIENMPKEAKQLRGNKHVTESDTCVHFLPAI